MKKDIKNQAIKKYAPKISKLRVTAAQRKMISDLIVEPITFVPDPRFNRPTVMKPIMEKDIKVNAGTPMTFEEEQLIFLQFNYARHCLCRQRRKLLRKGNWSTSEVKELLLWNLKQLQYRSKIVTCNMGLVLSMVQRVQYPGVEFTDLISEGSMALLRATEKFDGSRGFKFSTYACRAILKGFSRAAKQCYRHRNLFPAQLDPTMESDDQIDLQDNMERNEVIDEVRSIMRLNIADLSDIEKMVVQMRFSLSDKQNKPLTLKVVGDKLGLTKERIRQIQNHALDKLREVVQERAITL